MPTRQPHHRPRIVRQVLHPRMPSLIRPAVPPNRQRIRRLLLPMHRRLLAIHANPQPVPLARRNLRSHQHTLRPIRHLQQHRAIIVHLSPNYHRPQRPMQRRHIQPGHILQKMKRMRTDIANASARPAHRRIYPPPRLFLPCALQRLAQPPLQILHSHLANLAQLSARADRPRIPYHLVSRIRVRQPIRQPRLRNHLLQLQHLVIRRRRRLVAHHGDPRRQRGLGHR